MKYGVSTDSTDTPPTSWAVRAASTALRVVISEAPA